ncbi:hypothetical protein ACIBTV_22110 [Micromonospora sp. NPDC049366]|uniref:hypothetical protein n=1 Tax=Micromonospora sp. NPDC049366 TaxID=3364271 RepID=UPI003790D292
MTATSTPHRVSPAPPSAPHPGGLRHLLRHLGEMTLAMAAGMLLLAPLWRIAGAPLGLTAVLARPDVAALVMATNTTVGMTVWMRHRRHSRTACAEMAAAMYVPYLLLLVPYWAGRLAADTLMLGGHLLMVPAMVLVALWHRHDAAAPAPRRHPLVATLRHGWPAGTPSTTRATRWCRAGTRSGARSSTRCSASPSSWPSSPPDRRAGSAAGTGVAGDPAGAGTGRSRRSRRPAGRRVAGRLGGPAAVMKGLRHEFGT